ncbi:MAG: carboxymuconolactone decarboxylase family protein [Acidobacteria bacterium]|nr:carboxymuconolactone decarboxylase family protein [Acidobacteriota bacterium]
MSNTGNACAWRRPLVGAAAAVACVVTLNCASAGAGRGTAATDGGSAASTANGGGATTAAVPEVTTAAVPEATTASVPEATTASVPERQESTALRIRPVDPADGAAWTAEVRSGIEAFGVEPERATNLLRTLARHPPALHGLGPLAAYLRQRSMVPAVDQLLMGLRVAWLCRSEALWAELAAEARGFGLGDRDLRRVAEGPDAGWGAWDALMLHAADELYRDAFLSDASWDELATRFNVPQLIDTIFSGAEYILLANLANSLGVQADERFADRLPADVPRTMGPAGAPPSPLAAPRLDPLPRAAWSAEVRGLLDPEDSGGPVLNLYATLARHPIFFLPRAVQSAYIRTGATLSDRAREILILRIGWLCGSEYEWSQHVRAARRIGMTDEEIRRIAVGAAAPGWDPFDAALIRATDELHRDDTVSAATWAALSARYGTAELIDVVITVAGYRMVSIALNSLGTQLEPDRPRFPDVPR